MFALTWSVGGSSDDNGRLRFDKLVRELSSVSIDSYGIKTDS